MKISMFTNAYEPIIGGVERSIATFVEALEAMGHDALVVTLTVAGAEESEPGILRLPAVKEVSGTEFSMKLPLPAAIGEELDAFAPDVIHSHHPFMLGDTALRTGRLRMLPVAFTHHTLYEQYTYQFAPDSDPLSRFAESLSTEHANLCDQVIAPTESILRLIRSRGVEAAMMAETDTIRRYKERRLQADALGDVGLVNDLEDLISDETRHKEECEKMWLGQWE